MTSDTYPSLASGRYRLVSVLGTGGMATVYRGYDTELDVYRAIKVLAPELAVHTKVRERFQREARTMAKMTHPNIVMVLDVGRDADRVYMVMEEVTGGSLRDRLDLIGALPPRFASTVVQQVLAALHVAHKKNIVHRDIKPGNILLTEDGRAKVTDFGIARVQGTDMNLTRAGSMIGTLAFMAPEQRDDATQVDARADIYAIGATLYTLITGKESFEIFAAELEEKFFGNYPPHLFELTRRATRYHPEDRFDSALDMAEALQNVHASLEAIPDDEPPLGVLPSHPSSAEYVEQSTLAPISLGSSSAPDSSDAGTHTVDYSSFDEEADTPEDAHEHTWKFETPQADPTPEDDPEKTQDIPLNWGSEQTVSPLPAANLTEQPESLPHPPAPPPIAPSPAPPAPSPSPWGTRPDTLLSDPGIAPPRPPVVPPRHDAAATSPSKTGAQTTRWRSRLGVTGALIAGGGLAFWFYGSSSDGPHSHTDSVDISSLFEEAPEPAPSTTQESTKPLPRSKTATAPKERVRSGTTSPAKPKKAAKRAECTNTSPVEVSLNTKPYSFVTINNQREGDTKWKGNCDRGTHQVVFESANLKTADGQPKTHHYELKIDASTEQVSYCWNFNFNAICGN